MSAVITAALAYLEPPAWPVDGDCLDWSDEVTEMLEAAGLPARTMTVVGWIPFQGVLAIGFAHFVTVVDGGSPQSPATVVDYTARQFNRELPAAWVAPVAEYCASLAAATGVQRVTVGETIGVPA